MEIATDPRATSRSLGQDGDGWCGRAAEKLDAAREPWQPVFGGHQNNRPAVVSQILGWFSACCGLAFFAHKDRRTRSNTIRCTTTWKSATRSLEIPHRRRRHFRDRFSLARMTSQYRELRGADGAPIPVARSGVDPRSSKLFFCWRRSCIEQRGAQILRTRRRRKASVWV